MRIKGFRNHETKIMRSSTWWTFRIFFIFPLGKSRSKGGEGLAEGGAEFLPSQCVDPKALQRGFGVNC